MRNIFLKLFVFLYLLGSFSNKDYLVFDGLLIENVFKQNLPVVSSR